ncbi:MAG: DNA mismatch repair protein MutS [Gemmataceae bacterium]
MATETSSPATNFPTERSVPRALYAQRRDERHRTAEELEKQLDRIGQGRVVVFLVVLAVAFAGANTQTVSLWWLLVPVVIFVALLVRFDRVRRKKRRAERAVRFYDQGLIRLDHCWHGQGYSGERFLDEHHLYALDLDVFGVGSLFERICLAKTRSGEDTLARWLKAPAEHDEIRTRQAAVDDLRNRVDLREDVAVLSGELPPIDVGELVEWGQASPLLSAQWLRWPIVACATLNVISALLWVGERLGAPALVGVLPFPALYLFLGAVGLSLFVALPLAPRVFQIVKPIESIGRELLLLSGILARIEREQFTAPRLQELQKKLIAQGQAPSDQIARLAFLVDWLDAIRNQVFLPIALLLLWRTQIAFALERWREHSGPVIADWLEAISEIEALDSIASYAYENPDDPFPEIAEEGVLYEGIALGHPLLPSDRCVRNDVSLGENTRVLLVSGSNMSGKSTLLRTVGTNSVLALAGAPVRAQKLRLTPLAIGATLRVQDSLLEGRSRFFAEITRIRHILEQATSPRSVLFLLDELFHGTNSHDRCLGAEALLKQLLNRNSIGLLTTHDLTLTKVAGELGDQAQNVHFADEWVNGEMYFDYKLREGVVPHSNALALMRAIGLEV